MTGMVGKIVQYRKVGTFRVTGRGLTQGPVFHDSGWYECEPIKAPKRYRDDAAAHGGVLVLWVGPSDVIEPG